MRCLWQNSTAFLRVLNALENIRSSIQLNERALTARVVQNDIVLLRLSGRELQDAIRVLADADLHQDAAALLREARALLLQAIDTRDRERVQEAILRQKSARALICELGTDDVLCPDH